LEPEDCPKGGKNICDILQAEMDTSIAQGLGFSDEASFHTSGKVNLHNPRVWATENHVTLKHERDSPKVNVYCVVSRSEKSTARFSLPRILPMELITCLCYLIANSVV
jgi:hypothetical protein